MTTPIRFKVYFVHNNNIIMTNPIRFKLIFLSWFRGRFPWEFPPFFNTRLHTKINRSTSLRLEGKPRTHYPGHSHTRSRPPETKKLPREITKGWEKTELTGKRRLRLKVSDGKNQKVKNDCNDHAQND